LAGEYARALARLAAAELRAEQLSAAASEGTKLVQRMLEKGRNLLPPEQAPASDPIELVDRVRQRLRELERDLDRAQAERERSAVVDAASNNSLWSRFRRAVRVISIV
jgi:hypothetical protein